jgi:hypothetical protein
MIILEIGMSERVQDQMNDQQAIGTPFASADEAWIWAVKGMKSRLDGANVKGGMADVTRTCEASDIFLCARALAREGKITRREMQILLLYGNYSVAPAMLGERHVAAVPFWKRGMDALTPKMEQKGIIFSQAKGAGNAR